MDQPKIKILYEKIGNLSIMFYVLAYIRSNIAKECKYCTKLELISGFYHTRF